jgi:hypothetical protein
VIIENPLFSLDDARISIKMGKKYTMDSLVKQRIIAKIFIAKKSLTLNLSLNL